ncbi:MAG: hypothetical protein GY856_20505 [bacterium]|nr:hypothetical protein [bacterium]
MTLTLDLLPKLEERLNHQAQRSGLRADEYTLQLLDKHLSAGDRQETLNALLQSWMDEDDTEEQKETGEYLIRTLDEDRLSDRKLFPTELRGITW